MTLIKLDIDHKKIPKFTKNGLNMLIDYFNVISIQANKSPSGNFHMIIRIKERLTDSELIAIQFALGSDRKRERMNLIRYLNGNKMKTWNMLFTSKKRKFNPHNKPFDTNKTIENDYNMR